MRIVFALPLLAACAGAHAAAPVASSAPTAPTAAQVDSGRRLFARCAGCHQIGPNAGNVFGPQLTGVVGRKAGSVPNYSYSPALKKSALVWNEATLVAFIRDSDKVVPGNKMRFFSFMSEKQVRDIVAYLGTQGGPAVATPPRPLKPQG